MSFKDGEMHAVSALGALALSAALVVPTVWLAGGTASAAEDPPLLEELEAIEASLAYNLPNQKPSTQPQKPQPAPPPPPEAPPPPPDQPSDPAPPDEAAVPDPTAPPDPKPPPKEAPKPTKATAPRDPKAPIIPNRPDPDADSGTPVTSIGTFDPNAPPGFAEVSKGDPYFQRLAADFHQVFKYPSILEGASAVGCLHIEAEGTIAKTKIEQKSGDAPLDDALERALKDLTKLRAAKPEPVPTYLLKQATTRWICFRTKQQQRE